MITFVVDERVRGLAHDLLPRDVDVEFIDLADETVTFDHLMHRPLLAAVALAGQGKALRAALAACVPARLAVVELDPEHPKAGGAELVRLLMAEVAASCRQIGEARAVAAQMRLESMDLATRLREIEALLHGLGSPQFSKALSWQPGGSLLTLTPGQSVGQVLPMSAVSLTAIDLWFPQVVMPVIDDLAVTIEDAAGQVYPLQPVNPDMGLETGWLRFGLAEPIPGVGRDCRVTLTWSGEGSISLGLSQAVPDPRFRATPSAAELLTELSPQLKGESATDAKVASARRLRMQGRARQMVARRRVTSRVVVKVDQRALRQNPDRRSKIGQTEVRPHSPLGSSTSSAFAAEAKPARKAP